MRDIQRRDTEGEIDTQTDEHRNKEAVKRDGETLHLRCYKDIQTQSQRDKETRNLKDWETHQSVYFI